MAIDLRRAEQDDVAAIREIYNDAISNTTAVYSYEPVTLEERLAWFDGKRSAGLPVLVADLAGDVVGFATYGPFRAWPAYLYTAEHSVYVGAARRGQGVGKALLSAVLAEASAGGLHTLVAGIDADNAASLRLHESLGFERVAHFREVGYKFDRFLDLVFMQRLLV